MLFLSIVVFVIVISILIISHEFLHFLTAKRLNVKVEEFCIGFPPRIFTKKRGDTIYSIGILPGGGFVKVWGLDLKEKEPSSFYQKTIKKRAAIVLAGVLGNFLLAIILFSIGFSIGLPEVIKGKVPAGAKDVGILIVEVAKDSPAQVADIKIGDKIVKIENPKTNLQRKIREIEDVQNFTKFSLGEEILLTLQRGNKILVKKVIPRENPPPQEGPIGIGMVKTARISYPLPRAILKGFSYTFLLIKETIKFFFEVIKEIILKRKIVEGVELTGPVGIGILISQMMELGWIYVLQFTAILSLNLAILNILPFPALDGGRLVFLLVEKIRKRPVKLEIENFVNQIGFALLAILMIIITFRDIQKLFH